MIRPWLRSTHDVAIAKIPEEAFEFRGVPPSAFVVVIGDIGDHLQRMLVERQQTVLLHRLPRSRQRYECGSHSLPLRPAPCAQRWVSQNPPLLSSASEGFDLVALVIDLDQ